MTSENGQRLERLEDVVGEENVAIRMANEAIKMLGLSWGCNFS